MFGVRVCTGCGVFVPCVVGLLLMCYCCHLVMQMFSVMFARLKKFKKVFCSFLRSAKQLCVCVPLNLFYGSVLVVLICSPIISCVVYLRASVVFVSCDVVCIAPWRTREVFLWYVSVQCGMYDEFQVAAIDGKKSCGWVCCKSQW